MDDTPDIWQRKSSRIIADCRVFKVREDDCEQVSGGKSGRFFVVECPDWVNIIAVTRDRQVVLIKQFRHGVEDLVLEIPGGMIDPGEEPLSAAKRELFEETGYTSANWKLLGKSQPNPAIQNNEIYHFLAVNCDASGGTNFDEHESITTMEKPLRDLERLIGEGTIGHSLVVAAFYYFKTQTDS